MEGQGEGGRCSMKYINVEIVEYNYPPFITLSTKKCLMKVNPRGCCLPNFPWYKIVREFCIM